MSNGSIPTDASIDDWAAPAVVANRFLVRRLLAWVIDLAGAWFLAKVIQDEIVGYGFGWIYQQLMEPASSMTPGEAIVATLTQLVVLAAVELGIVTAVMVVVLRALGGTPGQLVVGMWTVPTTGATSLSLWPAAARMAMLYGPWVVVLAFPQTLAVGFDLTAPVLGLEWVPWVPWVARVAAVAWYAFLLASVLRDEQGRGFHDLLTSTVVVEAGIDGEDDAVDPMSPLESPGR